MKIDLLPLQPCQAPPRSKLERKKQNILIPAQLLLVQKDVLPVLGQTKILNQQSNHVILTT